MNKTKSYNGSKFNFNKLNTSPKNIKYKSSVKVFSKERLVLRDSLNLTVYNTCKKKKDHMQSDKN